MNNHQKQIVDNTSLVQFIGSRPFFPEGKTGFGVTGYGKVSRADVSGWATGVSKPFGSVFKPKRPNEDKRLPVEKARKVNKLSDIVPFKPAGDTPTGKLCVSYVTPFNADAWREKVAARIAENHRKSLEFQKGKVKRTGKVDTTGIVEKEKRIRQSIGIVGLDKPRKVKADGIDREKEDRNSLMLYWLELKSIYRLIYGG